jgi:alkylation response protein AidB-like acyl-CoA dehydrogenase
MSSADRTAVQDADFYLLEQTLEPEGLVADSEAIYSYEGTREINTLIVGRAITGLSAFA